MVEKTIPEQNAPDAEEVPNTREESRLLVPPVDIFEVPDALVVVADLPGVSKEEVDVSIDEDILTIKGPARSGSSGDELRREFTLMNYFRQFDLGEEVDRENIHAEMKHGVLTLRLPKVEEKRPRRIPVAAT